MRECLLSISMYTEGFASQFPFMGVAGRPDLGVQEFNDLEPPGLGLSFNAAYFAAHAFHWPTAIARAGFEVERIADPDLEDREALAARYGKPGLLGSAYFLTHTVVAAPSYWLPGPVPEPTPGTFRPMRTHQVRFPSAKGLLLAMGLGMYDDTDEEELAWILVGMADHSVSQREAPFGSLADRPFGAMPFPVLTTEGGLDGRDF